MRRAKTWLASPAAARVGVSLTLLGMWEVAARGLAREMYLSPPSRILASLDEVLATPGVLAALRATLWELGIAFILSLAIGLAVGLAVGLQRLSQRAFMPIILLLYGTPQIVILPLFILYFGIGPASKIAFGVSHGVFPVIVSVVAGIQNVQPALVRAAHSMGASRSATLWWVVFPQLAPSFFTGLRLAMTAALLGVLLAELYVSTAGIGHFTTLFTQSIDSAKLFGLIAVLATMAIVLNEVARRAEHRFSRHRVT